MDKTITRCCLALFFVLGVSAPLAAQGFSGEHDYNFYCATCHGEDGKGNGPKAADLEVQPSDLSALKAKYGAFPREKLLRIIDGRDPISGHIEREMPVWGVWFKLEAAEELGGAEGDEGTVQRRIDNLLDYIETLQP
jgi:hypothetical protein